MPVAVRVAPACPPVIRKVLAYARQTMLLTIKTARILTLGATMAVLVAGCGSGSGSDTGSSAAAPPAAGADTGAQSGGAAAQGGMVKIDYKDFAIDPEKITIKAGTKVEWVNQDSTVHNVVFKPDAPAKFTSKDFNKGGTATFTFDKPGVYPYLCTFHPASMQGVITVTG